MRYGRLPVADPEPFDLRTRRNVRPAVQARMRSPAPNSWWLGSLQRAVWTPKTWESVEGLMGFASETPSLDFKRQLGTPEDIAGDIAAMTVNGGVLLYGIGEDKKTVVASEVLPVQLAGAEERLRNIAGSRISPQPDFTVEAVADPSDPTRAVLAVVIPASGLAPHQANGRYPCRRGTTTDYLEEREVERLYGQREQLSHAGLAPGALVAGRFTSVLDGFQVGDGTGSVRLAVSPISGTVAHPAGPWQKEPLKLAVLAAIEHQNRRLANAALVKSWAALSRWEPNGTLGWAATNAGGGSARIAPQAIPMILFGACLSYPASFSFQAYFGLRADRPGTHEYRSASEPTIARELIAMLAIAGEYFRDIAGGGHLLAELSLTGFTDAKSQFALDRMDPGTVDLNAHSLPEAPNTFLNSTLTSSAELREAPERATRQLLERWLPPFYTDDRDLFDTLVPPKPPD
jgi:hypothetical protein